jgi:hypothetical protein
MANTPPIPATTIKFEAEPLTPRTAWRLLATLPTGQKEQIGEFETEIAAVAWIGSPRCLAWLKLRGYE